jgi:hypothetical protein
MYTCDFYFSRKRDYGFGVAGVLNPPTLLHQAINFKIDEDTVAQAWK